MRAFEDWVMIQFAEMTAIPSGSLHDCLRPKIDSVPASSPSRKQGIPCLRRWCDIFPDCPSYIARVSNLVLLSISPSGSSTEISPFNSDTPWLLFLLVSYPCCVCFKGKPTVIKVIFVTLSGESCDEEKRAVRLDPGMERSWKRTPDASKNGHF